LIIPRRQHYDPEGSFWEKVDRSGGNDACWIWTRAVDMNGYGALKVWGKKVNAHRYSYELAYGRVPEDKIVCHRCNERLCVNPQHLYAGTYKDNAKDMIAAGTYRAEQPPRRPGESNGQSILTEGQVLEIYRRAWDGEKQTQIAAEYGIDKRTVTDIKYGRSWAWLTGAKRK
jgi:HNH endonuclease